MAARIITITSGKGGVGKTTATANIGWDWRKWERTSPVSIAIMGLRKLDVVLG